MLNVRSLHRKIFLKFVIILIFLLNTLFSSNIIFAQEVSKDSKLAPLNMDFVNYLDQRLVKSQTGVNNRRSKLIPRPVKIISKGKLNQYSPSSTLPTFYDLRATGKLTPVRNQGASGSCWAFATYGSLESVLLPNENRNFSENNLKNNHDFDPGPDDGGNDIMSMAYLTRWEGPVDEGDDPFNDISTYSPRDLPVQKHVQEVLVIPDRNGPQDNNLIKQAVMEYGAVNTAMYALQSDFEFNRYYDSANYAFYYNGSYRYSNHAVDIVGWDDNFDRSRFKVKPSQNGAFIVRNSWGTSFGDNGYFYISYEDKFIGTDNSVFNNAEAIDNYKSIYQYDQLGWVSNYGEGSSTEWMANVFTSKANENVAAAGFYTTEPDTEYEMIVYSEADGASFTNPIGSHKGIISMPGYHTIKFDTDIPITQGKKFAVAVKITTPGYYFPIAVEYPLAGYSSRATASPGESYISTDGISWRDIAIEQSNTNVCLKVYTTAQSPQVGDVNGDGMENLEDALLILKYDVGYGGLTAEQEKIADVNKDNVINVKDALLILRYIEANNSSSN